MPQKPNTNTIVPISPDSGESDTTLSENHCAEKLGNVLLFAPIATAGLDAATILDSFTADKGASKPFIASTCALTFLLSLLLAFPLNLSPNPASKKIFQAERKFVGLNLFV